MTYIINILTKYQLTLLGMLAGAIGGYLYYYYIGCSSGACAISSNAANSTIYGAVLGGLLFSSFKTNEKSTHHSSTPKKIK